LRYVLLSADSPYLDQARALERRGEIALALLQGGERRLPFESEGGDQALLGLQAGLFWLRPLLLRCQEGRLGDVALLADAPLPAASRIGLRCRPWLRGVFLPSGVPPAGVAAAPWNSCRDLAHLLEKWGPPGLVLAARPSRFPRSLQLQTTTACSAACAWCPHPGPSQRARTMDEGLFRRILDQCAEHGPDVLELYFHAEPLQDGRLERLADLAKGRCTKSLLSIVTHERAIDPGRAASLASCGLDVVFVSVNVVGQEPVEALRRRLERIAGLRQPLRAVGKELVVVTLANFLRRGPRGAFRRTCRQLELPMESFWATDRAGSADIAPYLRPDVRALGRRCALPFERAYVRAEGSLALCCEDWDYGVDLGSAAETPIAELWNGARYRRIRRGLLGEGRLGGACGRCGLASAASRDRQDEE